MGMSGGESGEDVSRGESEDVSGVKVGMSGGGGGEDVSGGESEDMSAES